MAIMPKICFEITEGRGDEFKTYQEALCSIMSEDPPGVIGYPVD